MIMRCGPYAPVFRKKNGVFVARCACGHRMSGTDEFPVRVAQMAHREWMERPQVKINLPMTAEDIRRP